MNAIGTIVFNNYELPAQEYKSSGTKISVFWHKSSSTLFLADLKGRRWFSMSLLSTWQLHKLSISASPRLSPAAPHPDRPHALRDKHSSDAAWTLLLPSLSTSTPAALKPLTRWTLRGQRWTLSRAARRHEASHHISVWISAPNYVPKKV